MHEKGLILQLPPLLKGYQHQLSKLCHICSNTVITGGGYSNAKTVYNYQIALAIYLKIDVNELTSLVSHWKILV